MRNVRCEPKQCGRIPGVLLYCEEHEIPLAVMTPVIILHKVHVCLSLLLPSRFHPRWREPPIRTGSLCVAFYEHKQGRVFTSVQASFFHRGSIADPADQITTSANYQLGQSPSITRVLRFRCQAGTNRILASHPREEKKLGRRQEKNRSSKNKRLVSFCHPDDRPSALSLSPLRLV